jgi:phage gp29-like protein
LDSFHGGQLRPAALLWETIERRDDVLKAVASKRKKSVARLQWDILTVDSSAEARQQCEALRFFYNSLRCTNAADGNENGSFNLLVRQMMDAVGKKYAVHEIVYKSHCECQLAGTEKAPVSAEFRFVPLEFFENYSGRLRFLEKDGDREGVALEEGAWLVTVADGLMEACSIAYLFKHLPLRDWLVYCERNGMPGIKGITDAFPGTTQWEAAKRAVESFGAEFNALVTAGSDLQAIDLGSRGELPYPALVERMDRAMAALWCGSDLSTLSRASAVGASLQGGERVSLEIDDAAMISETLNMQVDSYVLGHLFGSAPVKAYLRLRPSISEDMLRDLELYERLVKLGLEISDRDLRERFGVSLPEADGEREVRPPFAEVAEER